MSELGLKYDIERIADDVNRPRTSRDGLEMAVDNMVELLSGQMLTTVEIQAVRDFIEDVRADISMHHPFITEIEVDELVSRIENQLLVAEL